MADETKPQATPARTGTMRCRLISAGVDDSLVIGDPDKDGLRITSSGVEVEVGDMDALIEIAASNSVALVFEPVEKGK